MDTLRDQIATLTERESKLLAIIAASATEKSDPLQGALSVLGLSPSTRQQPVASPASKGVEITEQLSPAAHAAVLSRMASGRPGPRLNRFNAPITSQSDRHSEEHGDAPHPASESAEKQVQFTGTETRETETKTTLVWDSLPPPARGGSVRFAEMAASSSSGGGVAAMRNRYAAASRASVANTEVTSFFQTTEEELTPDAAAAMFRSNVFASQRTPPIREDTARRTTAYAPPPPQTLSSVSANARRAAFGMIKTDLEEDDELSIVTASPAQTPQGNGFPLTAAQRSALARHNNAATFKMTASMFASSAELSDEGLPPLPPASGGSLTLPATAFVASLTAQENAALGAALGMSDAQRQAVARFTTMASVSSFVDDDATSTGGDSNLTFA